MLELEDLNAHTTRSLTLLTFLTADWLTIQVVSGVGFKLPIGSGCSSYTVGEFNFLKSARSRIFVFTNRWTGSISPVLFLHNEMSREFPPSSSS